MRKGLKRFGKFGLIAMATLITGCDGGGGGLASLGLGGLFGGGGGGGGNHFLNGVHGPIGSQVIPEPATMLLIGGGLIGAAFLRRRKS